MRSPKVYFLSFKRSFFPVFICFLSFLNPVVVYAAGYETEPEAWIDEDRDFSQEAWKEEKIAMPPYPKDDDLIEAASSAASNVFRIFVDAKNIVITDDGVVHYTVILQSSKGSKNVFFEGLRCSAQQYKVYGYGTNDGKVIKSKKPAWRSVFDSRRHDFRRRFAEHYLCSLYGHTESVETIVYRLENDISNEQDGARILGGDNVGW